MGCSCGYGPGPLHSLECNGLFAGHVHTSRSPDFRTWFLTIKYSRTVARLPPPPPPPLNPPSNPNCRLIHNLHDCSISPSLCLSLSLTLSVSVCFCLCFCLSISVSLSVSACLPVCQSLCVSLSPSQSPASSVYDSLPATPPLVILAFLHPPPLPATLNPT